MTDPRRTTVTTYRLARIDRSITLCVRCEEAYRRSLGPVEHGPHRGWCQGGCEHDFYGPGKPPE